MRVQAYLRIVGDEQVIRKIGKETDVAGASITELRAPRAPAGKEMWWNWQTTRIPIETDNLDGGLRALLLEHRSIFPIIKKHQNEVDSYLEVVTYYDEGEESSGLYLSAETIQLLGEMGGSLDHDVVRELATFQSADDEG